MGAKESEQKLYREVTKDERRENSQEQVPIFVCRNVRLPKFIEFKKPLAKIAGKPNKKENLAASSLFNPIINPPMIVEPEREHPGIKASA